ncbi:MAG: hypothetical protein LCH91_14225 [Bacteroidetes bacterium]|nr:hypothetical protein [Bacteroidota bacterium]
MTKVQKIVLGVALVVLTISMVMLAYNTYEPKPDPVNLQKINETIKKQSDSVAVAAGSYSDTTKLRKLEALKRRIAEAQYNDSVARVSNKRR